ncbi:MAG: hypothetical protein ACPHO9_08365, partial [Ilumatobacteraceae bacterium]
MPEDHDAPRWGSRRAIVTGAGSGIGTAAARALRELGVAVVAADIDDMKAYLADPLPTTHLVLVGGGGAVTKPLVDAVKAA